MNKVFFSILLILFAFAIKAQPNDTINRYNDIKGKDILDAIIIDGDTIPIMILDEILFVQTPTYTSKEAKRRYYILKRKVFKVYPYVVIAGNKRDSLNLKLAEISSKRKKKKLVKEFQRYIEDNFEDQLVKLTHSEGQILSKLLYRETGITTYELITTYRSSWRAFWWNALANYNSISLKTPYVPTKNAEDKLIEEILQKGFQKGNLIERVPITTLKPKKEN